MKKIVFILFFISINIFAQNPFSTPTILPGANTDMSQAVIFGDYDNDGWTDLYVSKGSDLGNSFLNLLYKNTSGSLTKQTVSGITDILEVSGSASWGDYNNDGYLDLYVANALNKKNNLFFGNSNGGFVNKTNDNSLGPIVNSLEDSRHVGWGDYNNDGYIDVFVKRANGLGQDYSSFFENINGTSSVQKNEAQIGAIVTSSGDIYKSLGATFGWCDYNNDGYLDI
ncbi:MAG: VCBS repeat-containing protein, partial [Ignavibacteriales bacterium]|nr:VCBS repeat-containing protein [Ignavibacteriales bacterium]